MRRSVRQADVDDGVRDGLTSAEPAEIVQLRRNTRRLDMENEVLSRAAPYFAKDVVPKVQDALNARWQSALSNQLGKHRRSTRPTPAGSYALTAIPLPSGGVNDHRGDLHLKAIFVLCWVEAGRWTAVEFCL